MASKTTSKTQKAKPRSGVKASAVTLQPTNAELRQELEARNRDLAESVRREKATAEELDDCKRQLAQALEQQAGTSKILSAISGRQPRPHPAT